MQLNDEDRKALDAVRVKITKHFYSLDDAVKELSELYGNKMVDLDILDWRTNQIIGKRHCPRYLFRGEAGVYPATLSTRVRLEQKFSDQSWTQEKKKLTDLLMYCMDVL